MNADVKTLWVASLRDGSFKKGKFGLRDLDDHYDATGVLCELAVSAGVLGQPKKYDKPDSSTFFGYMYGTPGDHHATGLPAAVVKWSGLSYREGYKVALMGDEGMSFSKLADWIEENL